MADHPAPTWPEMLARSQRALSRVTTLDARVRYSEPRDGSDDAELLTGEIRIRFAAPNSWRIDDEQGLVILRERGESIRRRGFGLVSSEPSERVPVHAPHGDLGWDDPEVHTRTGNFAMPAGPVEATSVAGRPAWEIPLASTDSYRADGTPFRLIVAFDEMSGLALRQRSDARPYVAEVITLEIDGPLPADTFVYEGTTVSDNEVVDERERIDRWFEENPPPVPHYWPRGLASFGFDATPETGAFLVSLAVPGEAFLDRRPLDADLFAPEEYEGTIHRWSDAKWQWALRVDSPLSDDELRRVIASIPGNDGS